MKVVIFCIVTSLFNMLFFCCEAKAETSLTLEQSTVINTGSYNQLKDKSLQELKLLRNEIFARKGYVFKDKVLQAYFLNTTWYKPNDHAKIELTDSEKEHILRIKEAEKVHSLDSLKKQHCIETIVQKLKHDFKHEKLNYLERDKVYMNQLKDFIHSINLKQLLASPTNRFSKAYYFEIDECEDSLELTIDVANKQAEISINDCALVKDNGEVIHTIEGSTKIGYTIEKDCSYIFDRITEVG